MQQRFGKWSGEAAVAASMLVMNVATYVFSLVGARLLGPAAFGEFSAVMGVLIIVNVVSLGTQTMAARRVSRVIDAAAAGSDTTHTVDAVITQVRTATRQGALAVLAVLLVLAPVGYLVLDLRSPATPVAAAVCAALMTLMGGQAGVLQGSRRWGRLTAQQLTFAVGRLGVGTLALLWQPTTAVATVAVAIGLVPVALVGAPAFATAHRIARPDPARGGRRRVSTSLREALTDAHTLLAFFAFANLDPILVRATTEEHRAGLFAAGLILTKAALFLPQFVLIVAFPGMATATSRGPLLRVLGAVGALGALATAGVVALPWLAVQFIGGSRYAGITGSLWLFTLLGTALALLQVVVYGELAGHRRRVTPVLWFGAIVSVAVAYSPGLTEFYLLLRVVTVALLLVVALVLVVGPISAPRRAMSDPRPR
ncbi:hypothetical protein [Kribbia dieselivorans]|uniref:hypothetical protein n=1 Tax=Kribbia dieselivorans TaxID=331526 RepID=UPI0012EE1480|nr:hypothetical protein [Kribbia dieselivorans]